MFALTPLAVALQGIGYGTLLTSLQGLVAVTIAPEPLEILNGSMGAVQPRRRVRRVPIDWTPPPVEEDVRAINDEIVALIDD